jgi:(2R)-3-sulfolactate dehydrogenase (NADP+)
LPQVVQELKSAAPGTREKNARRAPHKGRSLGKCTVTIAEAVDLVAAALRRCRTSSANALAVAAALVAAEADGHAGHGLVRVASYAAQAKVGKVDGYATPTLTRAAPGVVAVDAGHGFAYPALDMAVAALPDVAQSQGIAVVAIRRSHHCGVAGHPVEKLADRGLVALHFANTPAAIAPWGGALGLYGTNPIAFACPLPDQEPLVVDLSLSKVARGEILAAQRRGETIPEGWALDPEGRPATEADMALSGTMVPAGDAKGAALALMVELLAAGLTGANYATEASSFLDAEGPSPGTGQLIVAFHPQTIGGAGVLPRFAALAAMVEADGNSRLPGRRRLQNRATAQHQGLTVDADTLAEIERL